MTAEIGELRFESRTRDDVTVVAPHGHLGQRSYQRLRDRLLLAGTDNPRAIVVDLTDLHIDADTSFGVFTTVHSRLEQWPGVPVLLAADGRHNREQLVASKRVARYVPVHESVAAAIKAVDERPPRRVTGARLTNQLVSPRAARRFARHTCVEWELASGVGDDVMLLVGELVTNAVVHTTTEPRLRLELRGNMLSVAVYDGEPGEVTLRDPGPGHSNVHGLLLVAQLSTAWGCSPTSEGGKVVWATLRAR